MFHINAISDLFLFGLNSMIILNFVRSFSHQASGFGIAIQVITCGCNVLCICSDEVRNFRKYGLYHCFGICFIFLFFLVASSFLLISSFFIKYRYKYIHQPTISHQTANTCCSIVYRASEPEHTILCFTETRKMNRRKKTFFKIVY